MNNRKSKFLTFILSFLPGLGHMYLGCFSRGAVFMFSFFADIAASEIVMNSFHDYNIGNMILILLPVIWLISMVDSLVIAGKINEQYYKNAKEGNYDYKIDYSSFDLKIQNKKIISMLLSIIPGAGHMYLNLQKQGVELMGIFFLSLYLADWLNMGLFLIVVPIVWFYSLFDVMYKASQDKPQDSDLFISNWFGNKTVKQRNRLVGIVLIVIGAICICENIVFPEVGKIINLHIRVYVQTAAVSLLFIYGGIKLIKSGEK